MKDCIGIINLDEKEDYLKELIGSNTISAMPIAGRYRIIDFILSNLTNSGVECIGIFTKRKSYSLMKHLSNGRPWDLHRKHDALKVFNYSEYDPVYDDIHSFIENIEFIKYSRKEYIIISPSYMICNINYREALEKHKTSGDDITVIYKNEDNSSNKFIKCEEIIIDDNGKVKSIKTILEGRGSTNVNMEMYIMKTSLFIDIIRGSITTGLYKKVKEYIVDNLENLNVGIFEFKGYLSCINSLESYFNTNKEILNVKINRELFYENNPIYTKQKDESPTYYSKESKVNNSIIANGSYIEGKVENCIIGRKVKIAKGAIVKNSIVMENYIVQNNTIINNAILNSGNIVVENNVINGSSDYPTII